MRQGPGVSQLGVWHGVEAVCMLAGCESTCFHASQARFRLLNPVAAESWVSASLRVLDARHRCSFRYMASGGACLTATKKTGSAGRQFVVSIEGLDHYRARIFRPLSNKASGLQVALECSRSTCCTTPPCP